MQIGELLLFTAFDRLHQSAALLERIVAGDRYTASDSIAHSLLGHLSHVSMGTGYEEDDSVSACDVLGVKV